jgi:predicted TIM-barrel enzyme
MDRLAFHTLFKCPGPVVLPVIHVLDEEQAERNVAVAIAEGAPGVFLINHDFPYPAFLPIIRHVRRRWPSLWLGVNFLAVTGLEAFPVLGRLGAEGVRVDAYWADDARIDELAPAGDQSEADAITAARRASGWTGLYFGGTCFKKQREVQPEHYGAAAALATRYTDAVCTSGVATGHAADLGKIGTFRRAMGDATLALASGISPENAGAYASEVDCFMVATGINRPGDFYSIEPERLRALLDLSRRWGAGR